MSIFTKPLLFVTRNSPVLLAIAGGVGVVATAYLTANAALKAERCFIYADEEPPSNAQAYIKAHWRLYIPAITVGSLTIAAIVGSNHIWSKRVTGAIAAYTIAEKAFDEYKEKVIEKIGEKKEEVVRSEIAQKHISETHEQSKLIITNDSEVLCYESFSGRYFKSSMEELKKAQNDINYQIINGWYASLTDFYDLLGLPSISQSDDLGWNAEKLVELQFGTVLSDDGRPCIAIEFLHMPLYNYYRNG